MAIDVRALNHLGSPSALGHLPGQDTITRVESSLVSQRGDVRGDVSTRVRARKGEWEEIYFAALRTGAYSKKTSAAIAGVSEQAPYKRAKEDPEFAEREDIAYGIGVSVWEDIAMERATDGNVRCPPDKVITYMLGVKGLNPKHIVETSGPNGGPIPVHNTGGMDLDTAQVPEDIKRPIVEVLSAIERGEDVSGWVLRVEKRVQVPTQAQGDTDEIRSNDNNGTGAMVPVALVQQSSRLAPQVIPDRVPLVRLPI
jgi:hypothetical protein